ncbi:MAG: S-methyl-5-thioribose-1-phosphate isomerase [Candidatus Omnitrophica bacterium]|nr:S-methyl-5-thioribose-1-phosphate isomerase [Candidatus Omnitrophota bacterium]
MQMRTIEWKDNAIRIIDQTKLPASCVYLTIRDLETLGKAIKLLQVRGAPALGAAAGLGVYLGLKDSKVHTYAQLSRDAEKIIRYIGSSRPTAYNLFWGLARIRAVIKKNRSMAIPEIKKEILEEARHIIEEDQRSCRSIGAYGASLITRNDAILTVCNAGMLATIDYGTALGVFYSAHAQGKRFKVFACETRPLLQGARLTTWELKKHGIDVTLLCDSMAAYLMRQGKIKKVITGADRIARNADAANKIGTYSLAVLSHYHKIPFYVAAPVSTFDPHIATGKEIIIEERDPEEVTSLYFKKPVAAAGVKVCNPAFDVTPHELITAIITDKGIIRPPFGRGITKVLTS